jgi:hypothetical protein
VGAATDAATSDCGQTPLHVAVGASGGGWAVAGGGCRARPHLVPPAATAAALPPHPRTRRPPRALHQAAAGNVGAMRRLIGGGAKVDARDRAGCTPLHTAASEGRTAAAALLVQEARARLNAHDRAGCTPLHRAAAAKHAETAALLASAGASLCAANKLQQTPLDVAGPFAALLQQAAAGGAGCGGVDV